MADIRYNNGPAFTHPVTHQVVASGAWYEGAAHVDSEYEESSAAEDLEAVNDEQTDGAQDTASDMFACEFCGKEYKTEKNLVAHLEKCTSKPTDGNSQDQQTGADQ